MPDVYFSSKFLMIDANWVLMVIVVAVIELTSQEKKSEQLRRFTTWICYAQ